MSVPQESGLEYCDIIAAHSGQVRFADAISGYDYSIEITDGLITTGYHHFKDPAWILVDESDLVAEGDVIGRYYYSSGTATHLHFNYWEGVPILPDYDGNTSHPARLLGDVGSLNLAVYSTSSTAAMSVGHRGDLVEAGVGLAEDPYGLPVWHHVYDFEGNVRNDMVFDIRQEIYGDCVTALPAEPDIAVEPTNFPSSYIGTDTYITFPWGFPGWVVAYPEYTYALSGGGNRVGIELPVDTAFKWMSIRLEDDCVAVRWEVSGEYLAIAEFRVEKDVSGGFIDARLEIRRDGQRFTAVDCLLGRERECRYRVVMNVDGREAASRILVVERGRVGDLGKLFAIAPNPIVSVSEVRFAVRQKAQFAIEMYDLRGRRVATVAAGVGSGEVRAAQFGKETAQLYSLPSGCYFLRLVVNGEIADSRKAIIVR